METISNYIVASFRLLHSASLSSAQKGTEVSPVARPSSTMHTRPCAARKRPRSFSLPFRQLLLVAVAATTGIIRTAQAFILPSSSVNQALRSAQVIRMGKGGGRGGWQKEVRIARGACNSSKICSHFFEEGNMQPSGLKKRHHISHGTLYPYVMLGPRAIRAGRRCRGSRPAPFRHEGILRLLKPLQS